MDNNILLLDGNSLVNRAYYAIQRPMITREGIYTQGIFGFLNMLQKLEKDYEPGYIAVAFDLKAPTFRHKEYDGYKAGRKKMPPELAMEIPILKDILRAMNIAIVEQEGWEADDFLGTLSLLGEEKGLRPLVVTGDKDSLQLASDKTTIIYTKRGVSEFELYDTEKMKERYGLTPTQFIDLKGLMGDSSDNLPGIPGVGEKTALPLLQKYGSVEELILHAEEIPQKGLRQKVMDFAESARMTKHLATIVRNIPGDWDFEAMRYREPDRDKLISLYTKLEFNSFLRRLSKEENDANPFAGETKGAFYHWKAVEGDKNPFDVKPSFANGTPSGIKFSTDGNPFACEENPSEENPFGSPDSDDHPFGETVSGMQGTHPERTIVYPEESGLSGVLSSIDRAAANGSRIFLSLDSDGNHLAGPVISGMGLLTGDVFYWITSEYEVILNKLFLKPDDESRPKLAGHGLKDAYYPLYSRFPEIRDRIPETDFDTALAAYLLNPNSGKYDLEDLYFSEFHRTIPVPGGSGKNDTDSRPEGETGEPSYLSGSPENGPESPLPGTVQTDLFGLLASSGISGDGAGNDSAEGAGNDTGSSDGQNETGPKENEKKEQQAEREERARLSLARLEASEALTALYEPRLKKEDLEKVFRECELPLVSVMASMEKEGFRTESGTLAEAGKELEGRIREMQAEIYVLAGGEFNISSPKQLGTVLFEKLLLPAGKKTKSGYSTSAEVLEGLKDQHPIVQKILEYRTLAKLKSTYIDGMLPLIGKDGRIHAHFQQTVTATGRISCTEPNLQNIPVRYEEGKRLRKAFVPNGENDVLVGADYSQIELRVLACLSEDESLLDAFRNGEDIHRATAAKVLGKAPDAVTPEERSSAKAINFGLIYGKTGFGLAKDLGISVKAAEEYIEDYFAQYPTVRTYLESLKQAAKETGYATTLLGRKRPIPEINASAYMVRQLGERLAMNSPIQGTAADIIKLAMIRVDRALKEKSLKSRLILQVHDELILSCPKEELDMVKTLLIESMEGAVELGIPMKAELETGENWYAV